MQTSGKDTLSIIMPAHNEAPFLESAARAAGRAAAMFFEDYELIIVEDGSNDRTLEVAERLAGGDPRISVIHRAQPGGVGAAFKVGLDAASKEYVSVFHGRGGIEPAEIGKVWTRKGEADLIVPYTLNVKERPLHRRAISRGFTVCVNALFGLRLRYYNHFVLFRRAALKGMDIRTDSAAYQAEMLIKLIKNGSSYIEVGIRDQRPGPTTTAFRLRNIFGVIVFFAATMRDVHASNRTLAR